MLTNEEIINIKNSVDIVDIVSNYIPLVQKGKNFFGVCPFHDDHSPSMSVSREKQVYTCFSCGATGNVFNFVMDYENVSFIEAVKIIATKAGIDVKINTKTKSLKNSELYDIYDVSLKFYQNNINTPNGKIAKEYLYNRGINDKVISEFQIGLALKEKDLLYKILEKKGIKQNDIIKSGLILKNEYGYKDIYYDRIMFPLYDINGRVVGYSGRIYNNEDTSKYINTKETEIFKKGELLYNYHKAKDEARFTNTIIITEGFMDVIRAHTIGVKNVVATMGTAVTKNQISLIKRLASNVILCFDGDDAGLKATIACADMLLESGITPKIVRLEENLDPDEYILKYGKDKFLSKINNPINVMDFKLMCLKKDSNLNSTIDTANYINNVINELSKIDDDILKELTIKKIVSESKLDDDFIREKLNSKIKKKEDKPKEKRIKIKLNKYEKAESTLLFYMLKYKEVIKIYNKKITYMPTERYRLLAREISYFYKKYNYIDVSDLMILINDNELLNKTVGEILNLKLNENYTIEGIEECIDAIKEYNINYEYERLSNKLKEETDPIKKAEIGQKMFELKKEIIYDKRN